MERSFVPNQRIFRFVTLITTLACVVMLGSAAASAQNTSGTLTQLSGGVSWLEDHQSALGGWESMNYLEGWYLETLCEVGQKDAAVTQRIHDHLLRMGYVNGAWPALEDSALVGLMAYGDSPLSTEIALAVKILKSRQAANGSWTDTSTNSANSTIYTADALRALCLVGEGASPEAAKAVAWFKSIRNADGGWGDYPGAGSSEFSFPVVRSLAIALGASDAYVQSSYTYLKNHPVSAGNWVKHAELNTYVVMGDLARAQTSVNQIITAQHANGAWDFNTGGPGDLGTTALMTTALCRAQKLGATVSTAVISNALAFISAQIQTDGSIIGTGSYARIDYSSFAEMALIEADRAATETLARCRSRYIAHGTGNWHNYFTVNYYGSYCSGLAAATLSALGDSASIALATTTVNTIVAKQNSDGGWGSVTGSTSTVSDTAMAIYGLKRAGRQATTAFSRGIGWLQTAYAAGNINNFYKGWLVQTLAGIETYVSFRSALIADLVAAQHADGGWAAGAEPQSNCQATASILIGLQAAGADTAAILRARAWITANQNTNGGWGNYSGDLASEVTPTALAVWAWSAAAEVSQIGLELSTDKAVYDGGDKVVINVTSAVADLDRIQATMTDPDGATSTLALTRLSSTQYGGEFVVPIEQWPGRFTVSVLGVKGAQAGAASCCFDIHLNRPINIYPSEGAMIVPVESTLAGSNFEKEGVTHAASRWQVREASGPSDWTETAYDMTITGADVLTSVTLPSGRLRADTTYAWRVAYKDSAGAWSGWSVPTVFSTFTPLNAGINWLESHQSAGGGWDTFQPYHGSVIEALVEAGQRNAPECQCLIDRVLEIQAPEGNWSNVDSPISALIASGMSPNDPRIALGLEALRQGQDPAGSWNGNVRETARACFAFIKAGQPDSPAVLKAVAWLKANQNADGGWGYRPGNVSGTDTNYAYRVLKATVPADDPAITKIYQWYDANFVVPVWAYMKTESLEAQLVKGDMTRATQLANALVSTQNADGSWYLVASIKYPGTTSIAVTSLCRARRAGITGLDNAISRGVANLLGFVKANGDMAGTVEAVNDTAQASAALMAAGRGAEPWGDKAKARFEAYMPAEYTYQFDAPGWGQTDSQAWALVGLNALGASSTRIQLTIDHLLADQLTSGSWETPQQPLFTAQALLGLAKNGKQGTAAFVNGMNWLESAVEAGLPCTAKYQGWALMALEGTTQWDAFRARIVANLLAAQNSDGGWGEVSGQPSRTDTTAAVTLGLYHAGNKSIAIAKARHYLVATQNNDGGWGLYGGMKASQVMPTALAVWAVAETANLGNFDLTLSIDRRSYVGGETVTITVTSAVSDLDTIEASITNPDGVQTTLTLIRIDSTHFGASFKVPLNEWPGGYVIAIGAIKGTQCGAAARSFTVGLFRPINILPYDSSTTVSLSPTLQATNFDDSATTATHAASQWQIRDITSDPDYSKTVFDSGIDTAHLTSITVPVGVLLHGQTYAWCVRYQDSVGRWSAWSIETVFTTLPASQWGERIVFDMDGDIWMMSTTGSEPARLTAGPARDSSPRISPDGQWIAFSSDQDGPYRIWLMHSDGSGLRALTTFQSGNPISLDWSPMSDRIAASGMSDSLYTVPLSGAVSRAVYLPLTQFRHVAWSSQNRIAIELSPFGNPSYTACYTLNPDGTGLTGVGTDSETPAWTPDGSFVTYGLNNDIWRSRPDGTQLTRITSAGTVETVPTWSSDSATLFYRSYPALNPGVSTLMASAADGSRPVSLKYYNAAIGSLDTGVIALGSNMPPAQPAAVTPADSALNVSLAPSLQASQFSDPNAGDTHAASHWQVRLASESYNTAVVDEVSQSELTSYAVAPGLLVPGQNYFWRVCYTDNHGNIGPWSVESGFTTLPGPAAVQDRILIVAGGGEFTGNPIVEQTKFLAGMAYSLSRSRQVPAGQIDLLSAFPSIDGNGDGVNDVSAAATRQSLLAALNPSSGFASGCDKLIVYMVDHGTRDGGSYYFRINPTESISASELDAALDALQAARPAMKIAVVFDFCYSGGFVIGCAPAADQYRICISGSTQESLAIFSGTTTAGVSFSNFFFDSLLCGANFKCAFDSAREGILAAYAGPPSYPQQVPWLEDDGDGVISSKFDGARARDFYWGSTTAYGLSAPQIISVTPDQNIGGSSKLELRAEIAEGYAVQRVWVTIVAPSTRYAAGEPITTLREVNLIREGSTRIWSATVSDLYDAGNYHITYYAQGYDSATVALSSTLQSASATTLVSTPRPTVISKDKASRNAVQMPWTLYR